MSELKTRNFIQKKIASKLNPSYEEQLRKLLTLMEDYEREIESKVKPFKRKFFGKYIKKLEDEPICKLTVKNPKILHELKFELPPISQNKFKKREILTVRPDRNRISYEKIESIITAKSWALFDLPTSTLLSSNSPHNRREIASLTKILTCILTILLLPRFFPSSSSSLHPSSSLNSSLPKHPTLYRHSSSLQPPSSLFHRTVPSATSSFSSLIQFASSLYFTVSKTAANIGGTSSDLQEGDVINITDLLYALMLPSGNDAAYTLGEYIGALLAYQEGGEWREQGAELGGLRRDEEEGREVKKWKEGEGWRREENGARKEKEGIRWMVEKGRDEGGRRVFDLKRDFNGLKDPMKYFLGEMGILCQNLGLTESVFQNVHGMSTKINMSNANEVGLLTCFALKNEFFAKIVRTKTYSCWIYGENERPVRWENLNKLIDYGFHGVKTGITPNAGPCLSAYYKYCNDSGKEVNLVVVVLGCHDIEDRFNDAKKIIDWWRKEGYD